MLCSDWSIPWIVEDAGESLKTAVNGLGVDTVALPTLQVGGDYVLVQAQVRKCSKTLHIVKHFLIVSFGFIEEC